MAGIQISGLASGLNWQNIVNALIAADKIPENQWLSQQTTNTTEISSLSTLKSDLQSLQTAADAMTTGTAFTATSATLSNSALGWSASAAPNTNAGQYKFNVTHLASTSVLTGAADVGAHLSTSTDVSGVTIGTMNVASPVTAGVFTVNGAQITVTVGESLKDVFDAIATQTGTGSTGVVASYDPTSDEVTLASSSPITLGAANDTSNFLSAMGLYNNGGGTITSDSALGTVSLNSTIADSGLKLPITNVDSSGNGTFSINGETINYNVNTSTIQNVLNDINSSGAGITATFNGSNGQFTFTNNTTGSTGIGINETSGGLMAAMGLTAAGGANFVEGDNAQFTINGSGPFTSTSNNLDASADGIRGLTVTATSLGSQTVTVAADTSGISTAINNLIDAYNTVQTYIVGQTQITNNNGTVSTSPLSADQDIVHMQRDLQNILFNSVSGLSGGISSLDQLGLGFTGTSPLLTIQNQTLLNNVIATNPNGVAALFSNQSNGLVAQIDAYVRNATGSNGNIAAETAALTKQNSNLTNQITNLNTQLTATQKQLTTEFTNMEIAEQKYQSEAATMNSILNTGSSSSSSSSTSSPSTTQQSAFANASTSSATGG